jgi:hypothetical protein
MHRCDVASSQFPISLCSRKLNRPSEKILFLPTMKAQTRHVKYVFADVVDFTLNRTIEAQVEIIGALNEAFREATENLETIFLPKGDGICAGIIKSYAPPDSHIKVALKVLTSMDQWSEKQGSNRKCKVRFAINESVDNLIEDINRNLNVAGAGINQAPAVIKHRGWEPGNCGTRGL